MNFIELLLMFLNLHFIDGACRQLYSIYVDTQILVNAAHKLYADLIIVVDSAYSFKDADVSYYSSLFNMFLFVHTAFILLLVGCFIGFFVGKLVIFSVCALLDSLEANEAYNGSSHNNKKKKQTTGVTVTTVTPVTPINNVSLKETLGSNCHRIDTFFVTIISGLTSESVLHSIMVRSVGLHERLEQ